MQVINFKDKCGEKIVLMLGYFDCLHKGHKKLLQEAEKFNYKKAVFTFSDSYALKDNQIIFTFTERLEIFEKANIDYVIKADFSEQFKNMPPELFLNNLNKNFNIKALVCGFDYRFGKDATGGIDTLTTFCKENNIAFLVTDRVDFDGEKASSSLVKRLLKEGNIKKANAVLEDTYFLSGIVEQGRKVGKTIGFPTANISADSHKAQLKEGVYKVYSFIDGKKYYGLCNYGIKPTFENYEKTVEVYYKDFTGDLYGSYITLYFTDFLRDIIKFKNIENLKKQLNKDLESLND